MAEGCEQAIYQIIYIDKNPNNLDEGWGWVQVRFLDMKRFNIPNDSPAPRKGINIPLLKGGEEQKFILSINRELVLIRAQKSLTIEAVCSWLRSWAPAGAKVFPESRAISLDATPVDPSSSCFVYFILDANSNAIKIGWAKDVNKRMRTFQTSSPARLRLLKSVKVKGAVAAQELERSLHQRFHANRLIGEWFKAEGDLLEYVNHL